MTEPDDNGVPARQTQATTRALIAFPLAVLCLMGVGLLSGRTYILSFYDGQGSDESQTGLIIGAFVVSALLATVPIWCAWGGLRKLDPDEPWWVAPLLRASMVLAAAAIALRLVITALAVILDDGTNSFSRLFSVIA